MNQFKELLENAFLAGIESPFELKDQIVSDLCSKIEQKETMIIDEKSIDEFAKKIYPLIPKPVLKFLSYSNTWLSGSAVVSLLLKSESSMWKNHDWDIYFNTYDAPPIPLKFVEVNDYGLSDLHMKGTVDNIKIDLIGINELTNIQQVFDSFDINLVKIAFFLQNGSEPKLVATKEAIQDLILGHIRLSDKNNKVNTKTQERIVKYTKRGFRDLTGVIEKGILNKILIQEI